MPLTSPLTDACPPDESRTNTTSYTVKLTDPCCLTEELEIVPNWRMKLR